MVGKLEWCINKKLAKHIKKKKKGCINCKTGESALEFVIETSGWKTKGKEKDGGNEIISKRVYFLSSLGVMVFLFI